MTAHDTVGVQDADLYRSPRNGNTIAFLGDSITDIGLGTSYFLADNWAVYTCALSGGRLQGIGHYGVPGQQTTNIAPRIGQALQKKPTFLAILAGTNDMGQVLYGLMTQAACVRQITQNLLAMYHACLDHGTIPIACTVPPSKGNGFTTAQGIQRRAIINIVNEWIITTAQTLGIPCVDFYAALVDSGVSNTTNAGNWANIASTSNDGIHPTAEGSMLMAQALWTVLSPLVPPTPANFAKDVLDGQIRQYCPTVPHPNMLDNPLWLTSAGQPGVRPDSWALQGTATYTTTLGTDSLAKMVGNVLTVNLTGGAVGSQGGIQYSFRPAEMSNVNTGDLIRFRGRFRKDIGVGVQVQCWIGTQSSRYTPILISSAASAVGDGAWDLIFRAPQTGGFTCNLFGRYQSAAGNVVFGQVSAMNLTQCGLDTTAMSRLIPEHPYAPWN